MDYELDRRIDECRKDFGTETGTPFKHFFCPIMHLDEDVEMCKGHIINKAFGTCNTWVPQRADVDNFFGSKVESHFIDAVNGHGKDPVEIWQDPKLSKRVKLRIEQNGNPIDHYFPQTSDIAKGHSLIQIESGDGSTVSNIVVKKPESELKALFDESVQVTTGKNYTPEVIASVIKAAHLTLFNMLGYYHVFSVGGRFLADILKRFHTESQGLLGSDIESVAKQHFDPYSSMISMLSINETSAVQGTAYDNTVIACIGAERGIFAIGVVIKAGRDAFCVYVPNAYSDTIDTYFSFLKERPQSIKINQMQFFPSTDDKERHWAWNEGNEIRVPLSRL